MKQILIAALVFVGIFNLFFFNTQLNLAVGFLFLAIHSYFFFIREKTTPYLRPALISSTIAVLFAFLFSFRSNEIVQAVDIIATTYLSLMALYLYKYTNSLSMEISRLIILPFKTLQHILSSTLSFPLEIAKHSTAHTVKTLKTGKVSATSIREGVGTTFSLIKGIAIAVPLFFILFILLVQADPIFGKLTQTLAMNAGRRFISSFVVFILCVMFGIAKIREAHQKEKELNVPTGKSHELTIIMGSVVALFACFILVQLRYLFLHVGERELQHLGISVVTYSEYVRKGFFQLLVVSLLSSSIVVYALRYIHKLHDRQKQYTQLFASVLTVETGLLLVSAAKRLMLYADAHGLTRARIFGALFLVWLASLLVILLLRVCENIRKERMVQAVLTTTCMLFLLVNIVNIDGLIATRYKPTVNGEVDYFYLASVSDDAHDSWKPALEDASHLIDQLKGKNAFSSEDNRKLFWSIETIAKIERHMTHLIGKYGTVEEIATWEEKDIPWATELVASKAMRQQRTWQVYNMGEYQAYSVLVDHSEVFRKTHEILNTLISLRSMVSEEVQQSTPIDRSTNPPLSK